LAAQLADIGAGESPEMIELGQKIFRKYLEMSVNCTGRACPWWRDGPGGAGHSLHRENRTVRRGGHDAARGDSVSYACPGAGHGLAKQWGTVESEESRPHRAGGNPLESIRNIRKVEKS